MDKIQDTKKVSPTDEVVCEIVSKSIVEIVQMSENEDFRARCRETLQVGSDSSMETKLIEYFTKFMTSPSKKRSGLETFFEPTNLRREYISLESLIKDMGNRNVNTAEELDGFDHWQSDIPTNNA